jgi:hypothetical protein
VKRVQMTYCLTVVHVLWLLVEWPVRLPFEAGLFLCGRRITLNLSSHDDHLHTIYGLCSEICFICFCTLENCEWVVYQTVLRFLTTVCINWGEVTLYERGLLRAGFLSHGSCHIKWLLLLLLFGKPCNRIFREYRSMLNVAVYPAYQVGMFLKRMLFCQLVSAYLRPIRGIYSPYSNSVSHVTNDNRVARCSVLQLFKYGG